MVSPEARGKFKTPLSDLPLYPKKLLQNYFFLRIFVEETREEVEMRVLEMEEDEVLVRILVRLILVRGARRVGCFSSLFRTYVLPYRTVG